MTARHHRSEEHASAPKPNLNESEVESAILRLLDQHGSCSLDTLERALPDFTFTQVFFSVDCLSREGRLILRHSSRFDCIVSAVTSESQRRRPKGSSHQR
jgi:hypothetical protein